MAKDRSNDFKKGKEKSAAQKEREEIRRKAEATKKAKAAKKP